MFDNFYKCEFLFSSERKNSETKNKISSYWKNAIWKELKLEKTALSNTFHRINKYTHTHLRTNKFIFNMIFCCFTTCHCTYTHFLFFRSSSERLENFFIFKKEREKHEKENIFYDLHPFMKKRESEGKEKRIRVYTPHPSRRRVFFKAILLGLIRTHEETANIFCSCFEQSSSLFH